MYFNWLNFFVVGAWCLLYATADPLPKQNLKGVTVTTEPYARLDAEGKLTGFVVDLMKEIGKISYFDYELYVSPDGRYGNVVAEKPTGMIGELLDKKADFAIADLTVTEARKAKLDFSEPFIVGELAALMRGRDRHGAQTLEDIVRYNEQTGEREPEHRIRFGVLRLGATEQKLKDSNDKVAKAISRDISSTPAAYKNETQVGSLSQGIEQAKAGHYALIAESPWIEYVAARECGADLVSIRDDRRIYSR